MYLTSISCPFILFQKLTTDGRFYLEWEINNRWQVCCERHHKLRKRLWFHFLADSLRGNMSSLWCLVVSFCGLLPGLWLEIRLEMLTFVVSWFPPRGVLPGWWLKIRLEMLFLMVSWFPFVVSSPWCRGVVVSTRGVMVSTPWCRCFYPVVSWFPPCGVVVSTPWCRGFHPVVSTPWCRGFHPVVS